MGRVRDLLFISASFIVMPAPSSSLRVTYVQTDATCTPHDLTALLDDVAARRPIEDGLTAALCTAGPPPMMPSCWPVWWSTENLTPLALCNRAGSEQAGDMEATFGATVPLRRRRQCPGPGPGTCAGRHRRQSRPAGTARQCAL